MLKCHFRTKKETIYDQTGPSRIVLFHMKSYRTWQDLMDHTQPNKTIQDFAQPYKIKEANRVIQQYNPFKDLIWPHNTVQYNKRLDRNA